MSTENRTYVKKAVKTPKLVTIAMTNGFAHMPDHIMNWMAAYA